MLLPLSFTLVNLGHTQVGRRQYFEMIQVTCTNEHIRRVASGPVALLEHPTNVYSCRNVTRVDILPHVEVIVP